MKHRDEPGLLWLVNWLILVVGCVAVAVNTARLTDRVEELEAQVEELRAPAEVPAVEVDPLDGVGVIRTTSTKRPEVRNIEGDR